MSAAKNSDFKSLPIEVFGFPLPIENAKADIACFLYDLEFNNEENKFNLVLTETVYTEFETALLSVTNPEPGAINNFIDILQARMDQHLDKNPPDTPSLTEIK